MAVMITSQAILIFKLAALNKIMNQEKRLLIEVFENRKGLLEKAWDHVLSKSKDAQISFDLRKKGNAIFIGSNHDDKFHRENLQLYCKSLAFAPCGSEELGLAYANRSAFLKHIGKYKECLDDIERALNLLELRDANVKLWRRKIKCMKILKSTGYESAVADAQNFIDSIDCSESSREQFIRMLKSAKSGTTDCQVEQMREETIDLPVASNVFENVSIQYNKKYGRHLVAAKKYKPSNVILVEKLVATVVRPQNQYINCHHCTKICWSGVPCKECNWAMFCSEDCYKECYDDYHDIECSLISWLNSLSVPWPISSLAIKIIIKALKKAGGIINLKTELDYVDQMSDPIHKGFNQNGKFLTGCNIQSIYSLESKILGEAEQTKVLECTVNFWVGIIKHTKLMENIDKNNIDSLMEDDLILLGSLFIKITTVIMNNKFQLSPIFGMEDAARGLSEEFRGVGLAPFTSLINHNCNPNAKVCFTENGKIIVFAAHPIKKSSQIFISYCKEYYNARLEDRQTMLRYNFVCDCQACNEDWSPELLNFKILQERLYQLEDPDRTIFRMVEQTFLHSNDPERKLLLSGSSILKSTDNYCNTLKEKVENLSKKVIAASKDTRKPSIILSLFLEALYGSIANLYNGLKPQSFGKCIKST